MIKIKQKGILKYIAEYDRIGIWDSVKGEWIRFGLHNTENFEIYHDGQWINDKIIHDSSANEWKLIYTKLDEKQMINKTVKYDVR